ncbi:hypothetical protein ZWY2020_029190 [Hordeum vulgare]|nr:hypothetical protein ZWY2020_029190 [Hordeum vulgare]
MASVQCLRVACSYVGDQQGRWLLYILWYKVELGHGEPCGAKLGARSGKSSALVSTARDVHHQVDLHVIVVSSL